MEKKTKEQEEKDRLEDEKIKREARVAAESRIQEAKLKEEERKKKENEDRLKRIKKTTTKCKREGEVDFKVKIKYKCESVCGKKYYIFNNVSETYPFIDMNDIVLYDNPKHSNHNREAIVINYRMQGTGSKDFNKNKTVPYFLIKFIEPLDKLPFYFLDVNGLKVKTNKKIIFMDNVPYENLKLVYSTMKSDTICLHDDNLISKKYNEEKKDFEKKYDKNNNNSELNFKEFVKKTKKHTEEIIKLNEKELKKVIKTLTIKKKFINQIKVLIGYVKTFNPTKKKETKKETKSFEKTILYFNTILDFTYNKDLPKVDTNYLDPGLIIYIYIYTLLIRSKKKLKYITNFKDEIQDKNEIIKQFIEIIKKLKDGMEKVKKFFLKEYKKLFNNNVDDNLEKIIMKIVLKNIANTDVVIKPYTYKHFIMDNLKKYVRKYFKINSEFKPTKVFFKYANPELVKLELENQIKDKKERDAQFIKLNSNNNLVNPTSDKMFILTNMDTIFNITDEKKINDIDYYFNENVKIDTDLNQIEVKINIGLTIKDKKSKDVLFEDNFKDKSKDGNIINTVKKFVNSIQDNMECQKSKENILIDIKEIKKKLGMTDKEEDIDNNTVDKTVDKTVDNAGELLGK